jgi:gliding motility-associated-like protein
LNSGQDTIGNTVTYIWSPNEDFVNPSIENAIVIGNLPDRYKVDMHDFTLTAKYGRCQSSNDVLLDYYPGNGVALPDTQIVALGNIEIIPIIGGTGNYQRYRWTSGSVFLDSTRNLITYIKQSENIYFFGYTTDGCVETDSTHIKRADRVTPWNAFSPGKPPYDYWMIPNSDYYPDMVVQVYNRWGQMVFSQVGYSDNRAWTGNFKGKPVPIGTYYYVITFSREETQKGSVTIVK